MDSLANHDIQTVINRIELTSPRSKSKWLRRRRLSQNRLSYYINDNDELCYVTSRLIKWSKVSGYPSLQYEIVSASADILQNIEFGCDHMIKCIHVVLMNILSSTTCYQVQDNAIYTLLIAASKIYPYTALLIREGILDTIQSIIKQKYDAKHGSNLARIKHVTPLKIYNGLLGRLSWIICNLSSWICNFPECIQQHVDCLRSLIKSMSKRTARDSTITHLANAIKFMNLTMKVPLIIKYDIHSTLIKTIRSSSFYQIQETAAHMLSQILWSHPEHKKCFIEIGILEAVQCIVKKQYDPEYGINYYSMKSESPMNLYVSVLESIACILMQLASSCNILNKKAIKKCLNCLWNLINIVELRKYDQHHWFIANVGSCMVHFAVNYRYNVVNFLNQHKANYLAKIAHNDPCYSLGRFSFGQAFGMDSYLPQHCVLSEDNFELNRLSLYNIRLKMYMNEPKRISNITTLEPCNICCDVRLLISKSINHKLLALASGIYQTFIEIIKSRFELKIGKESLYTLSLAIWPKDHGFLEILSKHKIINDIINGICICFNSHRNLNDDHEKQFIKCRGHLIVDVLKHKVVDNGDIEKYKIIEKKCSQHLYQESKGRHKYLRKCKNCNKKKKDTKLYLCKRCFSVKYCSKHCQKMHWKEHKLHCVLFEP